MEALLTPKRLNGVITSHNFPKHLQKGPKAASAWGTTATWWCVWKIRWFS